MTDTAQALAQLARALGMTLPEDRPPLPKELVARALAQACDAHAASGGVPSVSDITGVAAPLPSGSALDELAAWQRGEHQAWKAGQEASTADAKTQAIVGHAVRAALARHGITEDE